MFQIDPNRWCHTENRSLGNNLYSIAMSLCPSNIKVANQSINIIWSSPNLIKLIYKPPRANTDEYNHYFRLSSLCLIQRFKCRILGIEHLYESFIYLFASCLTLFVPFLKSLGIIHDLFIYFILLVNEKCITNHKGIDCLKENWIG